MLGILIPSNSVIAIGTSAPRSNPQIDEEIASSQQTLLAMTIYLGEEHVTQSLDTHPAHRALDRMRASNRADN
jgi:hypothetical protein